ncbi:hypothetical protein Ndes2526A_g03757 [Nannochloris sp. 'desiccata']
MADTQEPQIGKDKETQELVQKAEENFPQLDKNEGLQQQANMGPGREAMPGEGQPAEGGLLHNVAETIKQANPATRDMREKHC